MIAAVLAFSDTGLALGERLASFWRQTGDDAVLTRCEKGMLKKWTKAHFHGDALVFIGSCGIAVRAIAPFLTNKTGDPAVIVIDEGATFVVSLLSGHIGGANDLAVGLARFLGATPVVTTATDIHGVFAIDAWAARRGYAIANPERIKTVSARLLAGETVRLQSDFPIAGNLPAGIVLCGAGANITVTHETGKNAETLRLIPPVLTLGVGCKAGTGEKTIQQAFASLLEKAGCHASAVARVCSIDLKAKEAGLLAFCQRHDLPFVTFSAAELMEVPGDFTASAFVRQVTGADNVCERSAVLGSGENGRLLAGKTTANGVALALAIAPVTLEFDEVEPA